MELVLKSSFLYHWNNYLLWNTYLLKVAKSVKTTHLLFFKYIFSKAFDIYFTCNTVIKSFLSLFCGTIM